VTASCSRLLYLEGKILEPMKQDGRWVPELVWIREQRNRLQNYKTKEVGLGRSTLWNMGIRNT
jgi:hypothetical protein